MSVRPRYPLRISSRSGSGLLFALASAAAFGSSGTLASSLLRTGWTPAAAVTMRIGLAAAVLTAPALIQLRGRWRLLLRALPASTCYGLLAVAGAQLFYFQAVQRLSVGVALLLEYTGPLLVVGWMWLRHSRRPNRLTILGAVVAVAGLVLVLDLTGTNHLDAIGVVWGLAAAVGCAAYYVLSSDDQHRMPPLVTAWIGLVIGALGLLAAAAAGVLHLHASTDDVVLAGHRTVWLVPVLGLALVAAVLAYVLGIAAARRLGATLAGFAGLAEVLFAVLFAWVGLRQTPTAVQAVGGLFVIGGVVLVRAAELRRSPVAADEAAVPLG